MTNNIETVKLTEIKEFYKKALQLYDGKREIRWIEVRFYPFVGINHTIRIRDGIVFVRISDMCRDMPMVGHEALALILVAKMLRKPISREAVSVYSKLTDAPEMREQASENRRKRGKKVITPAKGAVYDLDEIFDRINAAYFQGTIPRPVLSWSAQKTYHRLGHYSADHNTIVISRSFDDKRVPLYVVESVMHHEMLHIYHPARIVNGRRYSHTPAFRRDERRFADFDKAENWIMKNARTLKIRAKKSQWLW
jgi:hypothetical protein